MSAELPPSPSPRKHPFRPWLFFGVLVTPAILSLGMILVPTNNSNPYGGLENALGALVIGVVGAAIFGGVHVARCQETASIGIKVAIGIGVGLLCGAASLAIAFGGCLVVAEAGGAVS